MVCVVLTFFFIFFFCFCDCFCCFVVGFLSLYNLFMYLLLVWRKDFLCKARNGSNSEVKFTLLVWHCFIQHTHTHTHTSGRPSCSKTAASPACLSGSSQWLPLSSCAHYSTSKRTSKSYMPRDRISTRSISQHCALRMRTACCKFFSFSLFFYCSLWPRSRKSTFAKRPQNS